MSRAGVSQSHSFNVYLKYKFIPLEIVVGLQQWLVAAHIIIIRYFIPQDFTICASAKFVVSHIYGVRGVQYE